MYLQGFLYVEGERGKGGKACWKEMRIFKMCTLKTLYSAAAFKLLLHFAKCKMAQSQRPDS